MVYCLRSTERVGRHENEKDTSLFEVMRPVGLIGLTGAISACNEGVYTGVQNLNIFERQFKTVYILNNIYNI